MMFHNGQGASSSSRSGPNNNETNPQHLLFMTHTSTLPSFQRRTLEGARQIRDNLNTVIRDLQPFVETARTANGSISITSLLNGPAQTEPAGSRPPISPSAPPESVVINFDNNSHEHTDSLHSHAALLLNNVNAPNEIANNNNGDDEHNGDRTQQPLAEAQQVFAVILKYVPFVLILLAKGLYDHHEGIFNIIVLLAVFAHADSAVKKEATKRARRSISKLCLALVYIACCMIFIFYLFQDEKLYLNLIFIRTYSRTLTVWDLLWFVTITDFILKLITVAVKICITLMPARIIAFQKRGKIYLFVEAVSQLYRSFATIQPWLFYLLESYQGPEKIVGVFLSAFYMVSKGTDLMSRLKLLRVATLKLLQNMTVGSSPTKEQIQTAGEHCPICHDEYDAPVLLQCRHIFCESCVTTWFDREQTCPLCRAKIVDDPSWRDGSTTYFMQLF